MEKIKKIILSKEEQKTLRDYYKMAEEFQEMEKKFIDLKFQDVRY